MTPDSMERLKNAVPRGKPPKKGMLWCPYCCLWSNWIDRKGYLRAECCGISDSDFWVKTHNKLWDKGVKKRAKHKPDTDDEENTEDEE